MRVIDDSFREPERNLALDQVLLDNAEERAGGEVLRFWESPIPFVVLGVAQKLEQAVDEEACCRDNVPILRRCSAGGCVLQGPGCLCYTLVLDTTLRAEIRTIRSSYEEILGKLARAFQTKGIDLAPAGISDLAMDGRKVSGNAQRRRKRFILHHGTFLYEMPIERIRLYLREPSDRPEYRDGRTHLEFLGNLPMTKEEIQKTIGETFSLERDWSGVQDAELEAAMELANSRYGSVEWTRRR